MNRQTLPSNPGLPVTGKVPVIGKPEALAAFYDRQPVVIEHTTYAGRPAVRVRLVRQPPAPRRPAWVYVAGALAAVASLAGISLALWIAWPLIGSIAALAYLAYRGVNRESRISGTFQGRITR